MPAPYSPDRLPLSNLQWPQLIRLTSQANREIAFYDGVLQGMVNPSLLLSPLTMQEAVLSSKIEGTQATLEEVLEYEANQYVESKSKQADIQEILNYRAAMLLAINELRTRPLTLNLIRQIHEALMDSVRGFDKRKGEFRTSQNWIGRAGCTMAEASYVPPSPIGLDQHLDSLEKYLHFDEEDPLVQAAIIHAQFELIHPFMDGNGRVGRILIPLFLYERKAISTPIFYISAHLESNRQEYYARLDGISKHNDWLGWIKFFLQAVIAQAQSNKNKASQILTLYTEMKASIPALTRSLHAISAIDQLFSQPIFRSADFVENTQIPKATAGRLLKMLEADRLIEQLRPASGRTPAVYAFRRLLQIIE